MSPGKRPSLVKATILLGLVILGNVATVNAWAWNEGEGESASTVEAAKRIDAEEALTDAEAAKLLTGEAPMGRQSRQLSSNDTAVDEIVESILESGRQGRNLNGYDEVYSDPSVVEAIQKADDVTARNLIKDKLCDLGLTSCDYEDVEGKRPYLRPQDLIYAQPVAIRPVGRPIASVPYKNGPPPPPGHRGPYGPPRPMMPPRKVGYESGPPRPPSSYGPNSFNKGPIYASGSYSPSGPPGPPGPTGPIYGGGGGHSSSEAGIVYGSRPPGPIFEGPEPPPYAFEGLNGVKIQKQHIIERPAVADSSSNAVQQHVHHHYHHGDGDVTNKVVVPVPVAVNSGSSSLISNELHTSAIGAFNSGGFSPSGGSFDYKELKGQQGSSFNSQGGSVYGGGSKPIYEGNNIPNAFNNQGPATFNGQSGASGLGNSFNSGYNSQTASYHTSNPDFYKKELQGGFNGPVQSNGLSNYASQQSSYGSSSNYYTGNGAAGGDRYQGLETSRQENFDCVCIPQEQCPAQDIIGRKDDGLFLPVDPRNLHSDIEALSDEAVITDGKGKMTVIRVTKEAKNGTAEVVEEKKDEEVRKISKRDVSKQTEAESKASNDEGKANVEPVS